MKTVLSFPIFIRALRALNRFASEDETRIVLNGVFVEARGNQIILVATDGRAMAVLRSTTPGTWDPATPTSFIIPRGLIAHAARIWREGVSQEEDEMGQEFNVEVSAPEVTVSYRDDGSVTISGPGCDLTALAVTGNFPNWRNVVPTGPSFPVPVNLNAEYLERFAAAAKDLREPKITPLCIRGYDSLDGAAPFSFHLPGSDFLGLLMGMRTKVEPEQACVPSWVAKVESATTLVTAEQSAA